MALTKEQLKENQKQINELFTTKDICKKCNKEITKVFTKKFFTEKCLCGVRIKYYPVKYDRIITRFVSKKEYEFNKKLKETKGNINREEAEKLFEEFKKLGEKFWKRKD